MRPAPILDRWAAGQPGKVIANALGITPSRVKKAVERARRAGDPRATRRRVLSGERVALLAARQAGVTQAELAARYGVTCTAIRSQLRKAMAGQP